MSGEIEALGDLATGGLLARAVEPDTGKQRHQAEGDCRNCGAPLTGAYCSACGQKAHIHRTLAAFGHDLAHSVFHFDGKIWRTLPLLAWRPGDLTRRYVHGERAKFVSPFAIFLFSIFLMVALFGSTNSRFSNVDQPLSRSEAARALEKDREDLLSATRKLETEIAQDPAAGKLWAQQQITRTQKLLASMEKAAPASNAKIVAQRRLSVQQRQSEIELARLVAKRDAAQRAGQSTSDIDSDIRSVKMGADLVRGATQTFGINAAEGDNFKANFGIEALNKFAQHALENPQLALYKVQSNAYKFSWALILISVPFVWLLFFWRRDFLLFDHAVFVTYSIAFMTLLTTVCVIGIQFSATQTIATLALIFFPPVHMYRQLRGAYHVGRAGALVRTMLLAGFSVTALLLFALLILALGLSG